MDLSANLSIVMDSSCNPNRVSRRNEHRAPRSGWLGVQGGFVFKAHTLLYHSTLGSSVLKMKEGSGRDLAQVLFGAVCCERYKRHPDVHADEQEGHSLQGFQGLYPKNSPSHGQHLALTVWCMPNWLDSGLGERPRPGTSRCGSLRMRRRPPRRTRGRAGSEQLEKVSRPYLKNGPRHGLNCLVYAEFA